LAGCLFGGIMAGLAGILKSTVGLGTAFQLAAAVLGMSGLPLLRIGQHDLRPEASATETIAR
jgi:hypothetical protein